MKMGWIYVGIGLVAAGLGVYAISILNCIADNTVKALTVDLISVGISFLGVILVVITLLNQKQEFQRNYELQYRQQFESTFFQLTGQLQAVRSNVVVSGEGTGKIVPDIFEDEAKKIRDQLKRNELVNERLAEYVNNNRNITDLNTLLECLDSVSKPREEWTPYWRMLETVVDYIENSWMGKTDPGHAMKRKYFRVLSSGMSKAELSCVFYYALSDASRDTDHRLRLHAILDRFEFFYRLPKDQLAFWDLHHLYPHTRFQFLNEPDRAQKRVYA